MEEISVDEIKVEDVDAETDTSESKPCISTSETTSDLCPVQPQVIIDSTVSAELNETKHDLNTAILVEVKDEDEEEVYLPANNSCSNIDITANGRAVEKLANEDSDIEIIADFSSPSGNHKLPTVQQVGTKKVMHIVRTNVPVLSRFLKLPKTIAKQQQQTHLTGTNDVTYLGNSKSAKPKPNARRKRCHFVDEYTVMCNARLKSQISDTSDIVTKLDVAPATKRLMYLKEATGVERLFARPGRIIHSVRLFNMYLQCLTTSAQENEEFNFLTVEEENKTVNCKVIKSERSKAK